jgi:hypothetical protein
VAVAVIGSVSVVGGQRFLAEQKVADLRRKESVKELQHFVALTNDLHSIYAKCEKVLVDNMFTFQARFRSTCTAPVIAQLKLIDLQIQKVAPLLPVNAWTEIHRLAELMADDYRQAEIAAFMTRAFEDEVVMNIRNLCFKNRKQAHDKERLEVVRRAGQEAMSGQLRYYFILRDFILPGLEAMNARVLVHARRLTGERVPDDLARQANRLQTLLQERKSFGFEPPKEPFTLSAVKVWSSRNITFSGAGLDDTVESTRWAAVYSTALAKVFYGRPNDVEALIECGVFKVQARELVTNM